MALHKTPNIRLRSAAGKAEIAIFILIGIVIAAGTAFFLLKIVGHFEEHVDKVKKTKVLYRESLTWRPDSDLCEKRILADLRQRPDQTKADYRQQWLTEKSLVYIGKMSKLEDLDLGQCKLEDNWLRHLKRLQLKSLKLKGASVGNDCIKYVNSFDGLKLVTLGDSDIDDQGVERLSTNRTIDSLDLELNGNITNRSVKAIAKMKQLKWLNLGFTKVTDQCLADLATLPNLDGISLERIPLRASNLNHLTKLRRLRVLQLQDCSLGDQELEVLGKIGTLRKLLMPRNNLTNKGLVALYKLEKLRFLNIKNNSSLTRRGIKKLKRALPMCLIRKSKPQIKVGDYPINELEQDIKMLSNDAVDFLEKENAKPNLKSK